MARGIRILCVAAAAALSACAVAPANRTVAVGGRAGDDIDWAKVAQINRHARDNGNYEVVWINYPHKQDHTQPVGE